MHLLDAAFAIPGTQGNIAEIINYFCINNTI